MSNLQNDARAGAVDGDDVTNTATNTATPTDAYDPKSHVLDKLLSGLSDDDDDDEGDEYDPGEMDDDELICYAPFVSYCLSHSRAATRERFPTIAPTRVRRVQECLSLLAKQTPADIAAISSLVSDKAREYDDIYKDGEMPSSSDKADSFGQGEALKTSVSSRVPVAPLGQDEVAEAKGKTAGAESLGRAPEDRVQWSESGESADLSFRGREEWQGRIVTAEQLLELAEVDRTQWELEGQVVNKWESSAKGEDGEVIVTPMIQIKLRLKRTPDVHRASRMVAAILEEAKSQIPAYAPPTWINRAGDFDGKELMLELCLYDAHFGKAGLPDENGRMTYDLELASQAWERSIDSILSRLEGLHRDFGHIILPVGNDLLNCDNLSGSTTKLTPQTNCASYPEIFTYARKTLVKSIETLRTIAPVTVVVVPGNHDEQSCFAMGDGLELRFENCEGVRVDNGASLRKYVEWGQTLLMLTHGDKKTKSWAGLVSAERPASWGRTRFREAHMGHFHGAVSKEEYGFKARHFGALCGSDRWHHDRGYVGNLRSAQGLVWSRDSGEVCSATVNLDAQSRLVSEAEKTEVNNDAI